MPALTWLARRQVEAEDFALAQRLKLRIAVLAGRPPGAESAPRVAGLADDVCPPGWETHVSKTHKRKYYFNSQTGEQRWSATPSPSQSSPRAAGARATPRRRRAAPATTRVVRREVVEIDLT